jgi:hypothetical protein
MALPCDEKTRVKENAFPREAKVAIDLNSVMLMVPSIIKCSFSSKFLILH